MRGSTKSRRRQGAFRVIMRAAIIINPSSGRTLSAVESRADRARRWARDAGVDLEMALTTCRGHAAELAASIVGQDFDRVLVWGGDGTVNEAAGAFVGARASMGVVCGGSGDGLARSLGLPRDPEAAFRRALTGVPRAVDMGWLGDRHFLNIAGIGFDAEVARRFNARRARGTRGYVVESLSAVWSYRCERYIVRAAGREAAGPHFLVAFANGREYGSGLAIAPEASPSDGRLDMIAVAGGGPVQQFWRARRLFWRPMTAAAGIWRERLTNATVSGDRLVCHVDGETFEAQGELAVRISPGAINVIR